MEKEREKSILISADFSIKMKVGGKGQRVRTLKQFLLRDIC